MRKKLIPLVFGPSRIWYDTFTPYLNECKSADFKYAFEDFIEDFNFHKAVGFTTACSVMPNVMSNTQVDIETTGSYSFFADYKGGMT